MLRFIDEQRNCGGVSRREWLRIGSLAALSSGMSPLGSVAPVEGKLKQSVSPGFAKAKSVVIVFTNGGQSQLETWDPKPDAPEKVRGEFGAIRTAVPGTLVGEHLPRLAKLTDRFTILRTLSHEDLDHGTAFYLAMTGQYHTLRSANPPPSPDDLPTHGAVVKRIRPTRKFVHTAVHVNGPAIVPTKFGPGQFGGLLGRDYDPMVIGDVTAEEVAVPGLSPHDDLPQVRLKERQSLVEALDEESRRFDRNRTMRDMSLLYRQAFDMLSNPATRNAFDLSTEPEAVRDRYGRNRSGQALLLARRLVEARVPFITVFQTHNNRGQDQHPDETDQYGWDTHNDIFYALKKHLLPRFDLGFSAFLSDLDERGLLEETLVILLGEFGRAPLVALEPNFKGSSPGRKHWASAYSMVAAGAGVARGQVLGATDRHAAYPATQLYGPWDVKATIFAALGIDPAGHYTDAVGRIFPIASGRPIEGLYG